MNPIDLLPIFALVLGVGSIISAYFVIKIKDLIYASSMLAVLASLIAALVALIGFGIVSAYLVLVYVGAAVMFIIIAISMVGVGRKESKEPFLGFVAGAAIAITIGIVILAGKFYNLYSYPEYVTVTQAASGLLSHYLPVIALIIIAQAATLVEAISIARRGEKK
ncbi:NADH:ubiquinone oxidoreductase subunit 6 (chain J) [Caldisphaera lagunensis DSM 15908]|uniref:NADH:ubiquinone oxidoreductase subunit 6 (Chain J) n=1 Tax=Caldisphaera lagunensis (strain DSM 15908 / JCM 11604 / ANMR 0165 / IC-154) TaxID=1056495 RepID=L0ADM9_CALLD|nr:NADH-quinone oxidoreductase subunit J [Caldisphaera lagunensis]AFZ71140.1 NADH:ubiquinone oxidoreductase subunit 6 (chain J) [Caldisphaera lagunensis DSM 15908]